MFKLFEDLDMKSVAVGVAGTALLGGLVIGGVKLRNKLKSDDFDDFDDDFDDDEEEQPEVAK